MHPAIFSAAILLLLLVAAPAHAKGDPKRGEAIYERCGGCHSLQYDRIGPRHCGLIGRKAGRVADFDYTSAMRASGLTWNAATLDAFLAAPTKRVPGTAMGFDGIKDAGERRDLIAFLEAANKDRALCP